MAMMSRRARRATEVPAEVVTDPRGTWRRFAVLLWRARLPVVLIVVLLVVSKFAVDIGLDQTQYTAAIIAGDVSVGAVTMLVVAMVVSWALGSVSGLLSDIIEQIINRNLRRLVWRRVVKLPASFFHDAPPRETVSRITTDTDDMGRFLMTTVYPLLISAYTIFAIAGRVGQFDLRLSLVIIGFVPVLMFLSWAVGRLQYFTRRDVAIRNAGLTQRLAEYVAQIGLIKAFAVTAREQQRGDAYIGDLYRARIRTGIVGAISTSLFTTVGLIQTVVLIAVGVALINADAITTPNWVAFFLYSATATGSISGLTGAWQQAKAIQGTTARVAEIVDATPEGGGTVPMPAGGSEIALQEVRYRFDEDDVLREVTHTFPRGRLTVVVGPSGSGKSTLLRMIQRIYPPDAGEVRVHGEDAAGFELTSYRDAFASVGQDGPIVSGTIRENLLLGSDRQIPDAELIDALCLHADRRFLHNLPDGLDTQVGDFGDKLSGGQRHRIAIARALLRDDASFILLDEPTAALDSASARDALREIRAATRGRTAILVAHTPAAIEIADEVVVIEDGRITASGTPDQVREDNEFVREAFGGQGER